MADPNGNLYYSGRVPRARQRSNSDDQSIIPHLLALPYEPQFHPYLHPAENPQNIGVQFLHSCPPQDATQLNSDILHRHLVFDHASAATAVAYPESSQRTTSHALPLYPPESSGFDEYASCELATYAERRGSWPSHSQTGYSAWAQSPQRVARSPVSEPPESTSDESYQGSDVEEVNQMSPMLYEFQVDSPRIVDLPPRHMHYAQPSLRTFRISESVLQPVDDPENERMLRSPPDRSTVADDEPEPIHPSPSSIFSPLSPMSFGSTSLQGPGMRFQRDDERADQTNQFRLPTLDATPFSSPHSPTSTRVDEPRPPGAKQQKKSKMHQCPKCPKMFPRPSGLATHMNTHSGAKPYKCIVPSCEKSFAVRSNAKRHLRTHGINPSSPDMLSRPGFTVGFEKPMVTQVHDAGKQPSRYRWIHNPLPHGHEWARQATSSTGTDGVSRTAITLQASMSSTTSSTLSTGSDDEYDEFGSSSGDVQRSQSDFMDTDERTGTYPIYRDH